jgi:UDP-N-acetylmuramate dehydrogenase
MKIKTDLEAIMGGNLVLCQQLLACYTTFQVGGPAEYFVLPHNFNQVGQILKYCHEEGLNWYILGRGSNLLISDRGLKGVVILIEENLSEVQVQGNLIRVQAGALLGGVCKIAQVTGLSGLEFACGIPGTIGGAVVMNAGAYDGEMKDVLCRVLAVDSKGNFHNYEADQLELGYRRSIFQTNGQVVLEAEMELVEEDRHKIKEKMDELTRRREEKQPLDKASAGSTFKRPVGYFTGQLIDQCQLRGARLGGAAVSDKHCGFIVNDRNASAQDIFNLINKVQRVVLQQHEVELHPEIRIWGEFEEQD